MMNKGGNRDTSRLLMDRSVPGRVGTIAPTLDVPAATMPDPTFLRDDLPLPEVSEPEVVQYFTTLSQLNFSIDTHFYPLGSCTMKYNPKINDDMAFLAGFAGIHPLQSTAQAQGALELLYRPPGMAGGNNRNGQHQPGHSGRRHGELAGRTDDARLPPGARRRWPHQNGHTRQRPRHQPGIGGNGRV